jgi:hypothetical protein
MRQACPPKIHGHSSDPGRGYDYDTLADDLATVIERLNLRKVPKWLTDNARPFFTPETSVETIQWGIGLILKCSLKALFDCNHAVT